jgi:hypothetical protein
MAFDPVTLAVETGKKIGEAAFDAWAKKAYAVNCREDRKDLLCAALSGWAAEETWKESVTGELTQIRDHMSRIEQNLDDIRSSIDNLLLLTNLTHLKLDEVLTGTTVVEYFVKFSAYFKDHFSKLFPAVGPSPADLEALKTRVNPTTLKQLADDVLVKSDFPEKLGYIHRLMIDQPMAGKSQLLNLYARELSAQAQIMRADPLKLYELYENTVADLLYQQARAHLMCVYAAAALKGQQEISGKDITGPDPKALWADWEEKRREQLEEFNRNVEWIVLGLSPDVHGRDPYFLHPLAAQIFALADRFTATILGEYGLWGRIISMGDEFTGAIELDGKPLEARNKGGAKISIGTALDWWSRSKGSSGVLDTVHFASEWKVFRYTKKVDRGGKYPFKAPLPYNRAEQEVLSFKKSDFTPAPAGPDTVWFGSFTEVQRSGGGFALLSGRWTGELGTVRDEGRAKLFTDSKHQSWDSERLILMLEQSGRIEYVPFDEPQGHIFSVPLKLIKSDTIYSKGTNKVRLHVDFADVYRSVNPNEIWAPGAEMPRSAYLHIAIGCKPPLTNKPPASKINGYIRFFPSKTGDNPIIEITRDMMGTNRNINSGETHEQLSAEGNVEIGGNGIQLLFTAGMECELYTSGWDPSYWSCAIYAGIRNAYFVTANA